MPSNRFLPGNPGRPLGAINKTTEMAQALAKLKFDWIAEAVARFRDPKTPHASKDYVLGLIVDRRAPKLKAVEITSVTPQASHNVINIIASVIQPPQPTLTLDSAITPLPEGSDGI